MNDSRNETIPCALAVPFSYEIEYGKYPSSVLGLFCLFVVLCFLTVLLYIEEVVFLVRNFKPGNRNRLNRTIWLLAAFPMFTTTSLLGILIPRAGTLINLVSNTFFATVIYQLVELIVDYLGGRENLWIILGETRKISIRTPPLCCCLLCIPDITLTRKTFQKFHYMVLQVTVVRPLLMFIAAVIWSDNLYTPGSLLPKSAFLYIAIGNLLSTLLAIWGLVILRTAFRSELDKQYMITGKLFTIQLTLLTTSLASIISGVLVTTSVVGCSPFLPSKARGGMLYFMVMLILMPLYSLLGRFFYRRAADALDQSVFEDTLNIVTSMHVSSSSGSVSATSDTNGDGGVAVDSKMEDSPTDFKSDKAIEARYVIHNGSSV